MSQNNIAIQIQNLSKVYKLYNRHIDRLKEAVHPLKKKYHRPFYALKNINLEVKKGEILGIVGRNGAGKSTLLKVITGVLTQTHGTCRVKGNISSLLGLSSGFNLEMTGIENVYLNGTISGFSKKEMDKRINEIISFAEIGNFIHQPVKNYSSGMQARLSFATAIHIKPDILILDEVLSVGDALFKRKCFAKMEELFNSGCTILFVSHAVNSINEICSRAILLDQGEKILEGSPKIVTMQYQKLLYVEQENQQKQRREIIQLNEEINKKTELSEIPKDQRAERSKTQKPAVDPKPYFIPNFVPKSTVHYKNAAATIKDIEIKTLDGERVNALILNENYIYSYKITFNVDAENVVFAMGIKSVRGLIISSVKSGDGYKGYGSVIDYIPKGDEYLIEWNFTCALLPGDYYTNIGIRSFPSEKESIVLNSIIDASVFKVLDIPHRIHAGICHLNQTVDITELQLKCKK